MNENKDFVCPSNIKKICSDCGGLQKNCNSQCSFYLGQITPNTRTEEDLEEEMIHLILDSDLKHLIEECSHREVKDSIDDSERGYIVLYKCSKGYSFCYGCKEFHAIRR